MKNVAFSEQREAMLTAQATDAPFDQEMDQLLADAASKASSIDDERISRVWRSIKNDIPQLAPRRTGAIWLQRLVNMAACLIVASALVFSGAMAHDAWFRSIVYRLILQETDAGITVSLEADRDEGFAVPLGWEGFYFPSSIPDGFRLSAFHDSASIEMTDGAQRLLIIEEHRPQDPAWIDTQGKKLEKITLGHRNAYVIEGGGDCTIILQLDERLMIVSSASLTKGELMDLCQSVRRVIRENAAN